MTDNTAKVAEQPDQRSDTSSDSSVLSASASLVRSEQAVDWDYARYLPEDEILRMKVEVGLEGSLHLAINLLFHAYKEPRCNCVISPLSACMSMAMLAIGSHGRTRGEIMRAGFDITEIAEADIELMKKQIRAYRDGMLLPNDCMVFKSVLYLGRDIVADPKYVDQLKTVFDTEVKQFISRQNINNDFAKLTDGKIKKVLYNADKRTKMLLVSVFYFKPVWDIPFSDHLVLAPFYVDDETAPSILYMETRANLYTGFNKAQSIRVVEFPIQMGNLSFLVFLPEPDNTIEYLFLDTDACLCESLTKMVKTTNMEQKPIRALVPHLVLEHLRSFRTFLPAVGVDEAFSTERANFNLTSANNNDRKVTLSDIVARTVIEITAGTYFDNPAYKVAENDEYLNFNVNRAFFYALTGFLESERRLFLAFGYVTNPTECGAYSPQSNQP